MKRTFALSLAVLAFGSIAHPSMDSPHKAAFKKFQALVGDWVGKAGEDGSGIDTKVNYKMTAGGSVLVETLFAGTEHEMVTMFHMDGTQLVLTHYCSTGNQPFMMFKPEKDPNVASFEFVRATNMKPLDGHMHAVTFKFVDADHITSDWTAWGEGRKTVTAHFDLHRVKAKD